MFRCVLLLAAAALTGCATTNSTVPSDVSPMAPRTQAESIVVYVSASGNDPNLNWEGWKATLEDIPRLVQAYSPRTVTVAGRRGLGVSYSDAVAVRDALLAAGVKDVRIGRGDTED